MAQHPDPLPAEFTEAFERTRTRFGRLGGTVLFFSSIHSTNDVAAALASSGAPAGALVIADAQTAGRGRRGRTWFSPPGAGLYVSMVLEPRRSREPERALALLTLAAGVALSGAIEQATGLRPDIKWPNDLVVGPRKLAGILAEGIVDRAASGSAEGGAPDRSPATGVAAVVLGYGINVASAAYPAELADRATSLESELGRPVDRAVLCAETVASIAGRYDDLLAGRFDAILDAWHERAPSGRGARVQWQTPDGPRAGTTAGVDEMGALLVRAGGQTERLLAGEVTWLL